MMSGAAVSVRSIVKREGWRSLFKVGQPITSVPPATSESVSQSRQSFPPRQSPSANHVIPSRHVSVRSIAKREGWRSLFKVGS